LGETKTDARIRLSRDVQGPATVGHLDPVILLPHSFLSLDEREQRAIALHELIHVRRRDWLVTLMEELAGAFFWFSPGIWWLLAQAKLSREELVDAEVVERTNARESYIQALLSMSGVFPGRLVVPAALFLTRRHLEERVRSLLSARRGSRSSLVLRYMLSTAVIAVVVTAVFLRFPLAAPASALVMLRPAEPPETAPNPAVRIAPVAFNVRVDAPPDLQPETAAFTGPLPGSMENRLLLIRTAGNAPLVFSPPGIHPALWEIRRIRPGDVVPREEVARLLSAVPPGPVVEITQDDNNTVTRILISSSNLRRAFDETRHLNSDVLIHTASPEPAISSPPATGID
jgi:hypothetical protein